MKLKCFKCSFSFSFFAKAESVEALRKNSKVGVILDKEYIEPMLTIVEVAEEDIPDSKTQQ